MWRGEEGHRVITEDDAVHGQGLDYYHGPLQLRKVIERITFEWQNRVGCIVRQMFVHKHDQMELTCDCL